MISFETTVETSALLAKLRANRENHRKILAEAFAGYIEEAKATINKTLDELMSGRPVALQFRLAPPSDHTKDYDTAIAMVEMHTNQAVTLDSSDFANLVMDDWGWMRDFLHSNKKYSSTAETYAAGKGI